MSSAGPTIVECGRRPAGLSRSLNDQTAARRISVRPYVHTSPETISQDLPALAGRSGGARGARHQKKQTGGRGLGLANSARFKACWARATRSALEIEASVMSCGELRAVQNGLLAGAKRCRSMKGDFQPRSSRVVDDDDFVSRTVGLDRIDEGYEGRVFGGRGGARSLAWGGHADVSARLGMRE